jgi:hypothetical protein
MNWIGREYLKALGAWCCLYARANNRKIDEQKDYTKGKNMLQIRKKNELHRPGIEPGASRIDLFIDGNG